MTGDKLSAESAAQIGLIWQCVEDAEFGAVVSSTAARLASMPIRALVSTRYAMDSAMRLDYEQALSEEGRMQSVLSASHDYQEGVAAFMAKRAAVFSDR